MKLFTIGFTKKNAERFFGLLKSAGVTKTIDTRLNNVSQLAGFTKRDDLRYFLSLLGIGYEHRIEFAPTNEMLTAYKAGKIEWSDYENQYRNLIRSRLDQRSLTPTELNGSCLLCSEEKANHCHRRLLAEYFQTRIPGLEVIHLG